MGRPDLSQAGDKGSSGLHTQGGRAQVPRVGHSPPGLSLECPGTLRGISASFVKRRGDKGTVPGKGGEVTFLSFFFF